MRVSVLIEYEPIGIGYKCIERFDIEYEYILNAVRFYKNRIYHALYKNDIIYKSIRVIEVEFSSDILC